MSKGPRISPKVKQFVVTEALKDRKRDRRLLVESLKPYIERMVGWMPADETLEKLVSWARNHAPEPEDAPWMLGTCTEPEFEIPAEAIPAVLRVWKYCLVMDFPFTIREAKWVTRLHTLITNSTSNLSNWANLYAYREKSCAVLDKPFETYDLDAALVMGTWEWVTAHIMGGVSEIELGPEERWVRQVPLEAGDEAGETAAELLEARIRSELSVENIRNEKPGWDGLDRQSNVSIHDLTDEARWVCAHWLAYIRWAQTDKWRSLPVKKRWEIILQLREWVTNNQWSWSHLSWMTTQDRFDTAEAAWAWPPMGYEHFIPTEFLKEVGIEIEDVEELARKAIGFAGEAKSKEEQDERTHKKAKQE